jgi:uncharacterized coiled-coil DUF342 family protein
MDWTNVVIALGTVGTTLFGAYGLFSKKFEAIDKKFDKVNERFDKVFEEFKEVRKEINGLDSRLSNIEGQITQMTRPRFIINPKNDHEEPKEN